MGFFNFSFSNQILVEGIGIFAGNYEQFVIISSFNAFSGHFSSFKVWRFLKFGRMVLWVCFIWFYDDDF